MSRRTFLAGAGLCILLPFGGCISEGTSFGSTETDADPDEDDDIVTDGSEGSDSERGDLPISERFDCQGASRPQPDVAAGTEREVEDGGETSVYESIGSTEYPTHPDAFDPDTVRRFVEDHEEAYQQNDFVDARGDSVVEFEVMRERTELFDFHDEITTVRLDFAVHYVAVWEGKIEMTEPVDEAAVYAIDETGLVRTETDYRGDIDGPLREKTADPLQGGELLACF